MVRLHREKLMVRLGQGVFLRGALDSSAIRRTLQAFVRFKQVANHLRTEKVIAFGTSALREAEDRGRLLKLIRARTKIDVRVISGEEEAKLIALGILSNERVGKGRFALLDIGGGSSEISICQGRKRVKSCSFPLGTARLEQVFLKRSPPRPESVDELRAYVRTTILQKKDTDGWPHTKRVIGSSGTVRAISKILRKGGGSGVITRGALKKLVGAMSRMNDAELSRLPGMEPKRIDMILAGAILLEECMKALGAEKVEPTEFSLRDGILAEERQLFERKGATQLSLHLPDLVTAAERFGAERSHIQKLVKVSEAIFEGLQPLHRLKPEWKTYLSAAAILKNAGEVVTIVDYEIHSHYLIRHMDFPARETWEQEFVAELCLYLKAQKLSPKDLPFKRRKDLRIAFTKLLPLLQIVDALDGGREAHPSLKRIRINKRNVRVYFSSRGSTGLESLNVDLRKVLFEKTYRATISAEFA